MTTDIPKRYENANFGLLPESIKKAYPQIRENRKGLYIFGGVGTGKTFAAYAIYKKWEEDREQEEQNRKAVTEKYKPQNGMRTTEDGVPYYFEDKETWQKQEDELNKLPKIRPSMRFENVPQMLYSVKRDYRDNTDYQDGLINTSRVFILDDIGVEKVSEFVEEFMYLLINTQYEKVYPVVITSNLPLSALAEKLGDRIVSRIKEMCEVIEVKGEDKRLAMK